MAQVDDRVVKTTKSGQRLRMIDSDGHVMEYAQDIESHLDKKFPGSVRLNKGWYNRALAMASLSRGGPGANRVERGEDVEKVMAEMITRRGGMETAEEAAHRADESGEVAGLGTAAFRARAQMT